SLDSLNRVGMIRDTLPQPADTGIYQLQVRFSSLDENPAAASGPVSFGLILDQGNRVPRRSLVEMQTASWCATCPAHFQHIQQLEKKHQAVSLFHHVGDGMAHDSFRNLGSETVPAFAVNGHLGMQADTAAWIQMLQQKLAQGAPCSLKVLKAEFSASNELRFEVETKFEDLYQGDLRLFVALRERTVRGGGLPFDQFIAQEITTDPTSPYYQFPNQTGGFKHPDVAWVFLTSYRGTRSYMPAGVYRKGAVFNRSYSYTLPSVTSVFIPAGAPYSDANANAAGRFKPAETDIVAVLWDHSNPLKPEVLQATVQPLWDAASGLEPEQSLTSFDMWPNPAGKLVHLYFPSGFTAQDFTLLDVSGRVCMQGTATQRDHALDVSALKPGIYWLRAGSAARKLVVAP
ncbi:MAG: Secretion system C-terminal sorting domain, partial [Bacteroidota bacterium]